MKKRSLKSLKLNKRSISSLQQEKIDGGTLNTLLPFTTCFVQVTASLIVCDDPEPPVGPVDAGDTVQPPDSINICYETYYCA
jgi:hypothetical protein